MDWDDLRIVLAICRAGSLTGAARALGMNKSTVFRQLNAIETKMGVRFFERIAQGYVMTEAGESVMHAAARMEEEAINLERELLGKDFRLQGDIRLTAPEGVATYMLTPVIAKFCKQHPEIRVEVVTTNAALELSRREADLAVRVTSKPPDTSLGRCIGDFNFCVYGSTRFLKKYGDVELTDLPWVTVLDEFDWLIPLVWKKKEQARERVVFSSTLTLTTISAVKEDMGVMVLPCFLGDREKGLRRVGEPIEEFRVGPR
jgi:DNA-binding transcriptional LysR family regulator